MWRRLLTIAILATGGGLVAAAIGLRPGLGVAAALAISVTWIVGRVMLVRIAHAAFRAGRWRRAAALYGFISLVSWSRGHRMAARVSRAACFVAVGAYDRALELLDGVRGSELEEAPRAAWLNNRAYALARVGRDLDDALDASEQATQLRPNLASFRHTRGVILSAHGRYRAAIRELDAVWQGDEEVSSLLEAERCFDLGVAWRELGEADYAADYFDRARRASPQSPWARMAGEQLQQRPRRAASVVLDGA